MPRNRTASDSQPILQEEGDSFDISSESPIPLEVANATSLKRKYFFQLFSMFIFPHFPYFLASLTNLMN